MADQQHISCDVSSCKYNKAGIDCNLSDIQVSNTESRVNEKKDTGCMSFEMQ